jgi:DNA-binding MarR family transcriptional regulator
MDLGSLSSSTEPIDAEAAGEALFRLAAEMVRRVNTEVSLTSLLTLALLERTGPRRVTELAAIQEITQPSMTALVNRLENAGLVMRLRDPDDQRAVRVSLSPVGTAYLRSFEKAGAERFVRLICNLPDDEAGAVAGATRALRHLWELATGQELVPTIRLPSPSAENTSEGSDAR